MRSMGGIDEMLLWLASLQGCAKDCHSSSMHGDGHHVIISLQSCATDKIGHELLTPWSPFTRLDTHSLLTFGKLLMGGRVSRFTETSLPVGGVQEQ